MAIAMRCDRCGKYYDKNHKVVEHEGKRIHLKGMAFVNGECGRYYAIHKDLCDDCLDLLVEFFNAVAIWPVDEPGLNVTDDG